MLHVGGSGNSTSSTQYAANEMWDSLSAVNQELATILTSLVEQHDSDIESYKAVLGHAAKVACSEVMPYTTATASILIKA